MRCPEGDHRVELDDRINDFLYLWHGHRITGEAITRNLSIADHGDHIWRWLAAAETAAAKAIPRTVVVLHPPCFRLALQMTLGVFDLGQELGYELRGLLFVSLLVAAADNAG